MKINAVFEGGGVRGIALAGAAAATLDAGYEFDQTVGTSAGALVSSLVAAGFTGEDLAESICRIDWPGLLNPVRGASIPLVGRHWAMLTRHGIYDSARLEEVWGELLRQKGIRHFRDLPSGSLRMIVTDLSHSRGLVFPRDLALYGHDPDSFVVARAVRMSAAIPFVFTSVPLRDWTNGDRVLMADGALAANFPAAVADRTNPIVGFRLVMDGPGHDNRHIHVRGPLSLVRAVLGAGIRARYALPRPVDEGLTIVHVPVRNDLDFDMSPDEAHSVFERARRSAREQLEAVDLSQPPTLR